MVGDRPIVEAFAEIVAYAERKGVKSIGELPGLWEFDVDGWHVKVNGHREEIAGVPGYHAIVEYNGWPTLVMSPFDGISMLTRDGARAEDEFIAAIKGAA